MRGFRLAAFLWTISISGGLAQTTANSVPASPAPDSAPADAGTPWEFNILVDTALVPDSTSYTFPTFMADRGWLHLEARYNYEDLHTGSVWAGYNFSAGKNVVVSVTPMFGVVFGRTKGVGPGCMFSLTYKKIELSVANEYVFDLNNHSDSFYYSWPQLTYSPKEWLHVGLVAQRTKALQTTLDTQRGFLVGVSHKRLEFTTYVLNAGWTTPTVILEMGLSF